MSTAFAVSWDYRCPFARNAHEHLAAGIGAGAGWDVTFVPFSLSQVHVAEGDRDVWDDPAKASGLRAMQVGLVVRDQFPERFLGVHLALFAARHDEGRDIREPSVLVDVLRGQRIDPEVVFKEIDDGWPLARFRAEHEGAVRDGRMWGVPTFVVGDASVFVRLMTRPEGDAVSATRTIERVLDLMGGFPELNEFKHATIPR